MKSIFYLLMSISLFAARPALALPSDEMFEALKDAPTAAHAKSLEEDILDAMLESGSPTADLVMERALLAEQAGQSELARELLDRVVHIKPDFSEAWLYRALHFLSDDKLSQALLDVNEALTAEPRNFRAWLTLGRIFVGLDQNKEALEAYREALRVYPLYAPALSEVRRLRPLVEGRVI